MADVTREEIDRGKELQKAMPSHIAIEALTRQVVNLQLKVEELCDIETISHPVRHSRFAKLISLLKGT